MKKKSKKKSKKKQKQKIKLARYCIICVVIVCLTCVSLDMDRAGAPVPETEPEPTTETEPIGELERVPSEVRALESIFTTADLMDATILDLQAAMEAGHLTSEQLTQMYIDRINAYDKSMGLNSIIAINPSALEDARTLDKERKAGRVRGPLQGIPIIVKANIDVEGMATTAGARILQDMISPTDAFIVRKLKDSGAVILAQANMSEFAYATAQARSTLGGAVHNAYDTTRTPGGSSGGSAVAVTCNFAAAAIGTDTGGSIRNPSSFSNIYGMRPSKGLTSISGVLPLKAYKDTVGPMTRTAEDLAIVMEAIAGTDKADDYTVEVNATSLRGDGYTDSLNEDSFEGMRIGYLTYSFEYGNFGPSDSIEKMLTGTLENLEKAGCEIVDVSDIFTPSVVWNYGSGLNTETFEYDVNKYLYEKGDAAKYKTVRDLYYSNFDGNMHMYLNNITAWYAHFAKYFESTYDPYTEEVGNYQRVPGWSKMLEEREQITQLMEENDLDAMMYLNFFDVSVKEEAYITDPYNPAGYDIVFGPKHGLPEISLPMGFAETDAKHDTELPLGLSIFSGFGQEETLIKIAYAYEKQAGDSIRRLPDVAPVLPDERLNAFLNELIHKAYEITDSDFDLAYVGKVQTMVDACKKAEEVNLNDPYAVRDAARALAVAYDDVEKAIGPLS